MQLTIYKAGWIIGGSGGSGVLTFRGRSYALNTGGLDYGLVSAARKPCCAAGSATSTGPPMSPASTAPPAPARDRLRRPRHRAEQPEGRGAGTVGPADRPDGQRRPQRAGDHAEVAGRAHISLVVPLAHLRTINVIASEAKQFHSFFPL